MNEPTLTDTERGTLLDIAPYSCIPNEGDMQDTYEEVGRIVAARVAEVVARERATWVAKVDAVLAREFAHPCEYHVREVRDCAVCAARAVDMVWQETLRALLAADDTEGTP